MVNLMVCILAGLVWLVTIIAWPFFLLGDIILYFIMVCVPWTYIRKWPWLHHQINIFIEEYI